MNFFFCSLHTRTKRATTSPPRTRIEDRLRGQFLGVLADLLPPCSSSTATTPSPKSPAKAACTQEQEQESQKTQHEELVEREKCINSYSVVMQLTTELGIGGRLFLICTETFERLPGKLRPAVVSVLEETLYAGLMHYSCGGTHEEKTKNPELSLAELAAHTPTTAEGLDYNDSASSSNNNINNSNTITCPNASLLREAGSLMAFHESWHLQEATLTNPTDESRVADLCACVVETALKVANAAGDAAAPYAHPRLRTDDGGNTPDVMMNVNEQDRILKRRREADDSEAGTNTPVTWLRVTDPLATPEPYACGISGALRSSPSPGSEMREDTVEDEDTVHELGTVLAVLSEACDARTIVDSTAWQYGRNRISLASTTVITRHSEPIREGETHAEGNPTRIGAGETVENTNGESEVLGFFVHETGTLYTSRGERLLLEIT